jgi:hypothetical protein
LIATYRDSQNKLVIVLSRCNAFQDHHDLNRDGDILLTVCGEGLMDEKDAEELIRRLNGRLHLLTKDQERQNGGGHD